MIAAWSVGCEAGTPHDVAVPIGPPLNVVGFNGAAVGNELPADGNIQISFDRLLDPASITRQSFSLRDYAGNFLEPLVTYDPVTRIVSLSGSGTWLDPGVTYAVVIGVAKASDTSGMTGPKAIDGATLTTAVTETFQATAALGTPAETRTIDFCNDVLPLFQNDCSSSNCHGTPTGNGAYPREGLALDSPLGLLNTAIGRVSQESNTGAAAGAGSAAVGGQFGIDMPIIDTLTTELPLTGLAGNPANSWLMYKLLLAPGGTATASNPLSCGGTAVTPLPTPVSNATPANPDAPTIPISDNDRAILAGYMIGLQMPYPPNPALATEELERISAWISQGAPIYACPNCPGP